MERAARRTRFFNSSFHGLKPQLFFLNARPGNPGSLSWRFHKHAALPSCAQCYAAVALCASFLKQGVFRHHYSEAVFTYLTPREATLATNHAVQISATTSGSGAKSSRMRRRGAR
jgi:hypothetical protein